MNGRISRVLGQLAGHGSKKHKDLKRAWMDTPKSKRHIARRLLENKLAERKAEALKARANDKH